VPWATQEGGFVALDGRVVPEGDAAHDTPARAQRGASVWAAVGERVQSVPYPVQPDPVAGELEDTDLSGSWGVGKRDARLGGAHAGTRVSRAKKRQAFSCATAWR
jgi:hypothetical protein